MLQHAFAIIMYAQNRKWTTGMPRVIIGGQCVLSLCKVSMSFEVQGHSCLQFSVYDVTPNSPLLQHAFELKNEKKSRRLGVHKCECYLSEI